MLNDTQNPTGIGKVDCSGVVVLALAGMIATDRTPIISNARNRCFIDVSLSLSDQREKETHQ